MLYKPSNLVKNLVWFSANFISSGIWNNAKTAKFVATFNDVYKRTNTSYKPYPSGNSDYKSASSVERIEAFINLGVDDPVQYEDETGPVDYEVAKLHVEKLLAEYA